MRSFDQLQEIYSVRPPKVFGEAKDDSMRSETFVEQLNEWADKQGQPFHRWRADTENVNGGYPIFEPEASQP